MATIAGIRKQRNMTFIKVGMRIYDTYKKRWGRISGANDSGNINITLDGDTYSRNYHPKWKLKYFNNYGDLIKEYGD